MTTHATLLASMPWGASTMPDPVVEIALGIPTLPPTRTRMAPTLALAPGGECWLVSHVGVVVRPVDGGWTRLDLEDAKLTAVVAVVPTGDGAVVLGRDRQENVLAAVTNGGDVLWRRAGPASQDTLDLAGLGGRFDRLLRDAGGAIYLPGTKITGRMGLVDASTGQITLATDFGDYRGDSAWVDRGVVWRVTSLDADRFLVGQPLGGGAPSSVVLDLDPDAGFARGLGPLPDGGLALLQGTTLAMHAADGSARARLPLRGVVRLGDAAILAYRDEDATVVLRGDTTLRVGGLDAAAVLVEADDDGLWFLSRQTSRDPGTWRRVDWGGSTASATYDGDLLDIEGRVDLTRALVDPEGAVVVPGTDRNGAWVVRIGVAG